MTNALTNLLAAIQAVEAAPYRPPARYLSPSEAATLDADGLTEQDRATIERLCG